MVKPGPDQDSDEDRNFKRRSEIFRWPPRLDKGVQGLAQASREFMGVEVPTHSKSVPGPLGLVPRGSERLPSVGHGLPRASLDPPKLATGFQALAKSFQMLPRPAKCFQEISRNTNILWTSCALRIASRPLPITGHIARTLSTHTVDHRNLARVLEHLPRPSRSFKARF